MVSHYILIIVAYIACFKILSICLRKRASTDVPACVSRRGGGGWGERDKQTPCEPDIGLDLRTLRS